MQHISGSPQYSSACHAANASSQVSAMHRSRGALLPAARRLCRHQQQQGSVLGPLQVFHNYGFGVERPSGAPEGGDGMGLAFQDFKAIYEGKKTPELLRALTVLRLCALPQFVQHSEAVLDTSRKLLGDKATYAFVKSTFYKHFCAGEHAADVWSRMNALRAHGIGAILDYAEEEDLLQACKPQAASPPQQQQATTSTSSSVSARQQLGGESLVGSRVVARTYMFESEEACERHLQAFLLAIDTAANLPGQGFAAIKLTALGDPVLLERLSAALRHVVSLFESFDEDGDGFIDRQEFERRFEELLGRPGSASSTFDERERLFTWLDVQQQGKVDYNSWVQRLDLSELPGFAARLSQHQDQAPGGGGLSGEEHEALGRLLGRLERLVERAVTKGVKLMIDAEHSLFQPAIDHIAHTLMRRHNINNNTPPPSGSSSSASSSSSAGGGGEAVILLTYQAYLRDTVRRLERDLQRAEREGYVLGCKLVRGAYLHLERKRAAELLVPSPVFDRIEDTHASFHACLDMVMAGVKGGRAELMIGSHNQSSVERAVELMYGMRLDPETAPVYFGQLLGMADNLSFTLGHNGYRVFKYVPYGAVDKVVPYLLRRANENQYILKGGKHELELLQEELKRRLRDPQYSPLPWLLAGGSGGGSSKSSATV